MNDWSRTARIAAAALIRAEARSLRLLQDAVRRFTEQAAARLAALPAGERRRMAETAIRTLHGMLGVLTAAVADAVLQGRYGAKAASFDRLRIEWLHVQHAVADAGLEAPSDLPELDLAGPEDGAAGTLAAQSYTAAWGAGALALVWTWADGETGSLAALPGELGRVLEHRLRRVAATETAKAFADARDDGMGWVAEQHGKSRWFAALFKSWDANLDRKTCPVCSGLDGQRRLWGMNFEGGAEPGYIHPHCRCVPTTLFVPALIEGERIPGRQVDDEHPRDEAA